jgi:hypothetical protein
MGSNSQRVEHLFIVRMWYERGARGASPWRGSVEHVATKERIYFTNMIALTDFLDVNVSGAQPPEVEPSA